VGYEYWHSSLFFAETFWLLIHFGHLSHNNVETSCNNMHYAIFSDTVTKLTLFFFGHLNFRSMTEKNSLHLWDRRRSPQSYACGLNLVQHGSAAG